MEIRDTRNGDWHWVYNAVLSDPHLSFAEKAVYSAISTFGGHQVIHPTIEQIAARCSASERVVQLSLNKLEEVGYISVTKSTGRGNANVYYLLKSPKGCKLCTFYEKEGERVQNTAIKGANPAPHIDRYKDNNIPQASLEVEAVKDNGEDLSNVSFNTGSYISKLEISQDKAKRVLAWYFKKKKFNFGNFKVASAEIRRNLKVANIIASYNPTVQKLNRVLDFCGKYEEWTLETIDKKFNAVK